MKRINRVSLIIALLALISITVGVEFGLNTEAHAQSNQTTSQEQKQLNANVLGIAFTLLVFGEELALDDAFTAQQNTLLSVDAASGVLSNDTVQPNSIASLLQNVSNGILTLNPDGSFDYLPDLNFTGLDTFSYRLMTANVAQGDATVTIRVNGTPIAVDDDFIISDDLTFEGNVVVNAVGGSDTILDGAQVDSVINQATTLGGSVSIQANGDFQYTRPGDLDARQDSFVYTLRDNDGETSTATVTWQIGASFDGLDSAFSVSENQILDAQFTIITPGGLQALEVNGASFSLSQLNAASTVSALMVPNEQLGDWSITEFNETTGVLNFRYDPTGIAQNHAMAINNALREQLNIGVIDTRFATPFETQLQIDVLDTVPIVNNDQRSMAQCTSSITGNVVAGSVNGDVADLTIDPVSVTDIDFGAIDGTVGDSLSGNFGALLMNAGGDYTYTLNTGLAAVENLVSGESLTEVYTYTLTDNEAPLADSDQGTLTITINGVDIPAPITFSFTGANQTFTVPECIAVIQVVALGASGGIGRNGSITHSGGQGGRSTGNLTVTPGEMLTIIVGGQGGTVSPSRFAGGGGGGRSEVLRGTDRLIVAGGGGGGGISILEASIGGTGGGSSGGNGGGSDGGTGGSGGSGSNGSNGNGNGIGGSGGFGGGGNGGNIGGGGGGGGFGGGLGGSGNNGGGGGGGGLAAPGGTTTNGGNTGNGSVTFTLLRDAP